MLIPCECTWYMSDMLQKLPFTRTRNKSIHRYLHRLWPRTTGTRICGWIVFKFCWLCIVFSWLGGPQFLNCKWFFGEASETLADNLDWGIIIGWCWVMSAREQLMVIFPSNWLGVEHLVGGSAPGWGLSTGHLKLSPRTPFWKSFRVKLGLAPKDFRDRFYMLCVMIFGIWYDMYIYIYLYIFVYLYILGDA